MSYRKNDQHNHQRSLGNSVWMLILILREEEQGGHTYLLDVQPHKQVLKRLGEEQTTSIGTLLVHPEEEVLVQEVKEDKGGTSEAVDDRRDDRVSNS
jgi:hypothetical protein